MPLHVRITHHDRRGRSDDALALDRDEAWIEQHVLAPRRRGEDIFFDGRVIAWDDVDQLRITATAESSAQLIPRIKARRAQEAVFSPVSDEWHVAYEGEDVTDDYVDAPPGVDKGAAATADGPTPVVAEEPRAVMVVHGQDLEAARALFDWLRAIDLQPKEWGQLVQQTESASPFIGEVLDQAFASAQAVVVLLTPDERVATREELTERAPAWRLQARPNVLFEAGTAFATHPERTVLVVLGDQELPSDLAGRHFVRLSGAASLRDVARRLEAAGCPVDLSGDQWLDFSAFPARRELPAAPRIEATPDDNRAAAYQELLVAHSAMHSVCEARIALTGVLATRRRFDDAQAAVVLRGSRSGRQAAEAMRSAWRGTEGGRLPVEGWQQAADEARAQLITAIALDSA